ncbi:hypothetical protein [Desulfurobacterium indicum]|uniref:Uncharacterized protein n=1 Tax=Desulfurobacterium indicum TaxID=1914305 RepID=A0A1R1MLW5_9BACT|nr:hypothetical protein [Desulfurobacterium indicum]OMH40766.1 hypothetical protein BLW93_03570 [Desulfurobacterium indicum]
MVLKGRFSSYQEFFDLVKLVTQMKMTINLCLTHERKGKRLFLSFKDGSLVVLECDCKEAVLLDFNFKNGKVPVERFIRTTIFIFLLDFEDFSFETVSKEKEEMFKIDDFETMFLDVIREVDEISDFPEEMEYRIKSSEFMLSSVEEVQLLGYLLSGYSLYQSIFSMGKVKEFLDAYKNLKKKEFLS